MDDSLFTKWAIHSRMSNRRLVIHTLIHLRPPGPKSLAKTSSLPPTHLNFSSSFRVFPFESVRHQLMMSPFIKPAFLIPVMS